MRKFARVRQKISASGALDAGCGHRACAIGLGHARGMQKMECLAVAPRRALGRLSFAILISLSVPGPVLSQLNPSQSGQQGASIPIDQTVVDKLVWGTVVALDQAKRTGNYSVLRELGAPSFQERNSTAALGGIFEQLRKSNIDLSNTLVVSPVYEQPPVLQGNVLRARGVFPLRTPIGFDLMFQNISGEWRLLGISVAPLNRRSSAKN